MSRAAAPAPARESRGPMILLLLVMMLWIFAFTREPIALATAPGVIAFLAVIERARSTRSALLWISLFGAITIGAGYFWIADTIQLFGNVSPVLSYVATALFGMLGMAHGWIFIVVYRRMLARGRRPHPLITVALLCAVESIPYIRFFPWMVGHGAINNAPLLQSAEWGGVTGVSFVFLCLLIPFHEWLRWAFTEGRANARPKAALVTFVIGVAFYGWGMWRYADVNDEIAATSNTLSVAIVQANVGSLDKRGAERGRPDKDRLSRTAYEQGSRKAAAAGAELIVWPETSITSPVPFARGARQVDGYLANRKWRFIRELGAERAFLVGSYEEYQAERRQRWGAEERGVDRYNAAALRQPGGVDAEWTTVRKVYLIPFGEFMPFGLPESMLPQGFKMRAGESGQKPMKYKQHTLVPFLCYEGILPDHVRGACGGEQPDILVSLTNDSWFGDSWEPYQHLNFTRFRAVEHRAPIVRATNTGISAYVSASGDVVKTQPLGLSEAKRGNADVLQHEVRILERDRTVYASVGYMLPYVLWILSLLALLSSMMRPPPIMENAG